MAIQPLSYKHRNDTFKFDLINRIVCISLLIIIIIIYLSLLSLLTIKVSPNNFVILYKLMQFKRFGVFFIH